MGALEDLTLYAVVALRRSQPDRVDAVFDLARRVDGWDRIHAVNRLADTGDPQIKAWLLREGFRNTILDEYLAHTAATTGDLAGTLAQDTIDEALLEAYCSSRRSVEPTRSAGCRTGPTVGGPRAHRPRTGPPPRASRSTRQPARARRPGRVQHLALLGPVPHPDRLLRDRIREAVADARARQLLITSDHSVAEIAAAVGYPDPFYFSRHFTAVKRYEPARVPPS
ncbi:helix-turn-helix domain-containing protein [Micromonospora deserti]|uniref:helix-turn-helix domain-containing protein n=1 Tax=Micromonospora deserti TaxID=2070366 RepID=UPI0011B5EFDE|nr:helix-turn-helix domain-containing protein [Micromonospora deserti]